MNGHLFLKLVAVSLLSAGVAWFTLASFNRPALAPPPEFAAREAAAARVSAAPRHDEASLLELAKTDPAAAAKIFATFPRGDFHEVTGGKIATAFARVDPAGAFSWARTLDDENTRLRALREIVAIWAETDPAAAAELSATLGTERERQLTALAVATTWTRRDPAAALAWGASLGSLEARALVLGSAAQTWAERDAASALAWLASQSVEFHAAVDPLTTSAIFAKWAVQDPATVRDFVLKMPAGKGKIHAAESVTLHLAKKDPVATMQWALALEPRTLGESAFRQAFRQWTQNTPEQAQAWLHAADLAPDEKLRLLDYP